MTLSGPISNSFISQRLRLNYVDWGNSDAPPLLLVHGGRDHCRSWDWVAEELRHDWHVIAPDLRGHGDSAWAPDGNYETASFVYDLAQLVHQLDLSPVTIVAHSLGGNIATRYTGLYPENVAKLVCIEGLGPSPKILAEREEAGIRKRFREWIEDKRHAAGRIPKRYPSLDAALDRMKAENSYLTDEQAWMLFLRQCEALQIPRPETSLRLRINQLRQLTPGDFATARRQHRFRPMQTPEALLAALAAECAHKEGARMPIGFLTGRTHNAN